MLNVSYDTASFSVKNKGHTRCNGPHCYLLPLPSTMVGSAKSIASSCSFRVAQTSCQMPGATVQYNAHMCLSERRKKKRDVFKYAYSMPEHTSCSPNLQHSNNCNNSRKKISLVLVLPLFTTIVRRAFQNKKHRRPYDFRCIILLLVVATTVQ